MYFLVEGKKAWIFWRFKKLSFVYIKKNLEDPNNVVDIKEGLEYKS